MKLEDPEIVSLIKELFAPDGGAEREHNATLETLGFGLIHYALVTNLRPENVLVIGSRYGYIPSVIGLALRSNGSVFFMFYSLYKFRDESRKTVKIKA